MTIVCSRPRSISRSMSRSRLRSLVTKSRLPTTSSGGAWCWPAQYEAAGGRARRALRSIRRGRQWKRAEHRRADDRQLRRVGPAHEAEPRCVPTHLFSDQIADGDRLGNGVDLVDTRQGRLGEDAAGVVGAEDGQLAGLGCHPSGDRHQQRRASRAGRTHQDVDAAGRHLEVDRTIDRTPRAAHLDSSGDDSGWTGVVTGAVGQFR